MLTGNASGPNGQQSTNKSKEILGLPRVMHYEAKWHTIPPSVTNLNVIMLHKYDDDLPNTELSGLRCNIST